MNRSLSDFADVFAALADPNRRAVLDHLVDAGEGTATTLAQDLPFSRQAVVKHLAQLERAQLVRSHRQGKEVRYRVHSGRLAATAQGIGAIAAGWDQTLTSLKQFAEETVPQTLEQPPNPPLRQGEGGEPRP
jgi:DNA-binding transcriptional ArsR family regulator